MKLLHFTYFDFVAMGIGALLIAVVSVLAHFGL